MAEPTSPHPDAKLLTRVRAALDWWEAQPAQRPTSSIAGTGAIVVAEHLTRRMLGVDHVLALPSSSAALLVALRVLVVGPGDEVLVPALDWTAGAAAVRLLGARPVPVLPVRGSVVLDPADAARRRSPRTRAAIATHLLGVAVDVPALRGVLPGVAIVEDCAQAWEATLDGRPLGAFGDLAVLGGKGIDVDGIGFLATTQPDRWSRAVQVSQHPIRQWHDGCEVDPRVWCQRVAPLSALVAAHELSQASSRTAARCAEAQGLVTLAERLPVRALLDDRRAGVPGQLPVIVDDRDGDWLRVVERAGAGFRRCGALPDASLPAGIRRELAGLASTAGVLVSRAEQPAIDRDGQVSVG